MRVAKSKLVIFSVAVAFVSVFFLAYTIQAFYPSPHYENFCHTTKNQSISINNVLNCLENTGIYERNIFFANIGVGILIFIIAFFLELGSISSGLMGGSVMLVIYGSIRYWGELNNTWRALMFGVALSILIWLGYKKIKE